jgi:peptidoglycan/xylan/chitin deacetylase (PgdA/CDA1 family)
MKRFQLLVVVALFMVIASCTTNQSALLPPLPEVEAHVISGRVVQARSIASATSVASEENGDLETEFQSVLVADDVDKATRAHIDRIAKLFYRTQALLVDYDAKIDEVSKLDNPPEGILQTDDTYAKLISAWSLRQTALEKIKFFYKRSLEISREKGNDSKDFRDRQDRALLVKRAIRNGVLSASNSTNRLAKQEILRELIEVHRGMKDAESLNFVLKAQLIDGADEMTAFYARNETQLQRETEAVRGDEDLNREIDARLPEIRTQLTEQFQKRTPQSKVEVKPGVGRSGMMNGTEFSHGTWALTFDDGPHPVYTLKALANLKANNMKATFFWVANNVERMTSIVHTVMAAGMTLGNHSYTHAELTKVSAARLTHEIIDSTTVDVHAGYRPMFYRCPYGACGSQTSVIRQKIANLGMISVTWNVDSLDWQDKNPASVYQRVKKQMAVQKRGIILFHDIHPQSIVASNMLMKDFAQGAANGTYRTVTIDEALKELNSPEGMK